MVLWDPPLVENNGVVFANNKKKQVEIGLLSPYPLENFLITLKSLEEQGTDYKFTTNNNNNLRNFFLVSCIATMPPLINSCIATTNNNNRRDLVNSC